MVKRNERDYRESLQEFAKRSREIISANEQLISQYICQVEELKQKKYR